MRRLSRASARPVNRGGLFLVALGAILLLAGPDPATAQDEQGPVSVIQVNGLIDPIEVSFIEGLLADAEEENAAAFLIQLNSPGVAVDDDRFAAMLDRLRTTDIPVAVWIGPAGSTASGRAAEILATGDFRALAPKSRITDRGQRINDEEAFRRGLTNIGFDCERERGSVEGCAATVGDMIVSLGPDIVPTREVEQEGETRLEPDVQVRFLQLNLIDRLLHNVASPPVAYLLFVIGMALLLFELFTAGVGVAGVVGAGSFLLGCYGLAALPARPAGIALLVFAMLGYAVDIQTGVPRVWTGIATASFVIGSLVLYDGLSMSWVTLLAAIVGITVAMLAGMPAMVRTRFSTPTIGREWMVGEEGEARTAVDPEGTVLVRGAPWKARTNRATPIGAGDLVRVAAIEGLVLEVEPVDGAARDYRER